ncbi:MAG TPA: hypothetical protein DEF88_14170 [Porphyromonadaceae bacterium]|mgnify:FL=1|jgi:hypothetical protein|nr:hypothetical protein [Porphyromonadaceae bacterium]HCM19534.1 hypothetical protein [Porphyromonadaceae bacterium]
MKKILSILFMATLILGFASCKDDNDEPAAKLTLDTTTEVVLKPGESKVVTVKTGNPEYKAVPAVNGVITIKVKNDEITLTGIKDGGETTIAVTDAKGQRAEIKVKVGVPTVGTFVWDISSAKFDEADQYGITLLQSGLAVTQLSGDKKQQYYLLWTGGLSAGDKTGGKLYVVDSKTKDAKPIDLTSVKVSETKTAGTFYIAFSDGTKNGDVVFVK